MDDNIFNELLKIVYEYIDNHKMVDTVFYERVFNIFKSNDKSAPYLNELVLIGHDDVDNPNYEKYTGGLNSIFGRAGYNINDKNLVVFYHNIERDYKNVASNGNLNDRDKLVFVILLVMQTLLHEYEHVLQKYTEDNSYDYEGNILRALLGYQYESMEAYEYSLYERLAEVKAFTWVLKMVENLGIDSNEIYDYFSEMLNNTLKKGYHYRDAQGYLDDSTNGMFVSPTEWYAKFHGKDISELVGQIVDIDERIWYGLPISVEEYNKKFLNGVNNSKNNN